MTEKDRGEEMLELIKSVEKISHDIVDKQEEVTEVSKKIKIRRLQNHFTADIETLLRGF
jgi:hypothetical protein